MSEMRCPVCGDNNLKVERFVHFVDWNFLEPDGEVEWDAFNVWDTEDAFIGVVCQNGCAIACDFDGEYVTRVYPASHRTSIQRALVIAEEAWYILHTAVTELAVISGLELSLLPLQGEDVYTLWERLKGLIEIKEVKDE